MYNPGNLVKARDRNFTGVVISKTNYKGIDWYYVDNLYTDPPTPKQYLSEYNIEDTIPKNVS